MDHAGVEASGPCQRCGSFLCATCLVAGSCAACLARDVVEPRPIGGWLLLANLSLFVIPLQVGASVLIVANEVRKVGGLAAAFELDPRWCAWTAIGSLTMGGVLGLALWALLPFLPDG